MRNIELKTDHITALDKDNPIEFDYKKELLALINAPSKEGFTIDEIDKRLRLKRIIENAKDNIITIEETDFALLRDIVISEKWRIADEVIINFVNDIKNAEQTE